MLVVIEGIFDTEELTTVRRQLDAADWQGGRATAGGLAVGVKSNQQLADRDALAKSLGETILSRLGRHPTFLSAALPDRIYPPKFNRYADGGAYGTHIDGAVMTLPNSAERMRTDLSATLFLTSPAEYDGGELSIETDCGAQQVKLAAGDLVLYPSSSLHRVHAVTRGVRLAAFFWVQSMIRDTAQRALLFEMDQSIQALTTRLGTDDGEVLRLNGLYHNLMRSWGL